MVTVVRVVMGLIATFFLVFGLRFMFTPDTMAGEFFVSAADAAGLSTIRADLGGSFIAMGAFIVLGLRNGATLWLHAAALAIGAIALGRLIGFAADGVAPSAVTAFIVEVVFVVLLLIGARRLGAPAASV